MILSDLLRWLTPTWTRMTRSVTEWDNWDMVYKTSNAASANKNIQRCCCYLGSLDTKLTWVSETWKHWHTLTFNVWMLLALKLDQLIWVATRGKCNDEMIRLWVHTRYSQFPSVGSFTCLSIEHWIQGTLWLNVTCDWPFCIFVLGSVSGSVLVSASFRY